MKKYLFFPVSFFLFGCVNKISFIDNVVFCPSDIDQTVETFGRRKSDYQTFISNSRNTFSENNKIENISLLGSLANSLNERNIVEKDYIKPIYPNLKEDRCEKRRNLISEFEKTIFDAKELEREISITIQEFTDNTKTPSFIKEQRFKACMKILTREGEKIAKKYSKYRNEFNTNQYTNKGGIHARTDVNFLCYITSSKYDVFTDLKNSIFNSSFFMYPEIEKCISKFKTPTDFHKNGCVSEYATDCSGWQSSFEEHYDSECIKISEINPLLLPDNQIEKETLFLIRNGWKKCTDGKYLTPSRCLID